MKFKNLRVNGNTMWKEEQAWRDTTVPDVEAGDPGNIPMTAIEDVWRVTIEREDKPEYEERRRRLAAGRPHAQAGQADCLTDEEARARGRELRARREIAQE